MSALRSRPLAATLLAAAGAYLAVLALYGWKWRIDWPSGYLWVLAGAVYTNAFEYGWHRWGMHGARRDERHQRHHRLFRGESFATRDPVKLREVTTSWYIFPILIGVHAAVFPLLLPTELAPAFFLGPVLQYSLYESTHWWTHVEDNRFDRVVRRIPVLGRLRAAQIRHHRLHHAEPLVNYNFTPPYGGDMTFGTMKRNG